MLNNIFNILNNTEKGVKIKKIINTSIIKVRIFCHVGHLPLSLPTKCTTASYCVPWKKIGKIKIINGRSTYFPPLEPKKRYYKFFQQPNLFTAEIARLNTTCRRKTVVLNRINRFVNNYNKTLHISRRIVYFILSRSPYPSYV
jgi:hypothetical protein